MKSLLWTLLSFMAFSIAMRAQCLRRNEIPQRTAATMAGEIVVRLVLAGWVTWLLVNGG